MLFITDSVGASDIEINPANPDVVYVWMWRGQRKPWTIISGAPDALNGSFFKSTDGGEHFKKITNGLPTNLVGKGNLAVTAANPNRVYALVEAKPGGGLYRSDDAGRVVEADEQLRAGMIARPFYYTTIGADPTNAGRRLRRRGERSTSRPMAARRCASCRTPHTRQSRHLDQSEERADDDPVERRRRERLVRRRPTWSTQNNQPTAEIYGVWMDDQFPYRIYGAQQDASTVIVPSLPVPGQTAPFEDGPGCETGPIMPHPKNPEVVYGACKGQFGRMFMNTRAGAELLDRQPVALRQRREGSDPIASSACRRWRRRSSTRASSTTARSTCIARRTAACTGRRSRPISRRTRRVNRSSAPATRSRATSPAKSSTRTLYAISESKLEKGVIWTGSNDGPFYISRDDGKTWKNITPKDLPKGGRVQYIETSPHRKGSAYYAVYRYLLGDYRAVHL